MRTSDIQYFIGCHWTSQQGNRMMTDHADSQHGCTSLNLMLTTAELCNESACQAAPHALVLVWKVDTLFYAVLTFSLQANAEMSCHDTALCQLVRDTAVPAKANSVRAPVLLCQARRKALPLQSTVFLPRPIAAHSCNSTSYVLCSSQCLVYRRSTCFTQAFGLFWKTAANKHRVGNIS